MDAPLDPDDLALLLTPKERDSLAVSLLPRLVRGAVDRACATTKQARYNARKRAEAKLADARRAA